MSVFNPYGSAPGANAYQPGPFATGYQYPGMNTGYGQFSNFNQPQASTAISTSAAGGGGGGASAGWAGAAGGMMQAVAQYNDDAAAARSAIQNAAANTENIARTGAEARRTSQFGAELADWQVRSDRHRRYNALISNVARNPQIRANMRAGSPFAAALNFGGRGPTDPGSMPTPPRSQLSNSTAGKPPAPALPVNRTR
jgi:hypothetical protein